MLHRNEANLRTASHYDQGYTHPHYSDPPACQKNGFRYVWGPALMLLGRSAPLPVFELGCGCGQFASMVRNNGYEYLRGVDFSSVAIEIARRRNPNLTFLRMDIHEALDRNLRCPGPVCYVMLEVLEHLGLAQAKGVLERIPAGSDVLFSVPNFETNGHTFWFDDLRDVLQTFTEIDVRRAEVAVASTNRWFHVMGERR